MKNPTMNKKTPEGKRAKNSDTHKNPKSFTKKNQVLKNNIIDEKPLQQKRTFSMAKQHNITMQKKIGQLKNTFLNVKSNVVFELETFQHHMDEMIITSLKNSRPLQKELGVQCDLDPEEERYRWRKTGELLPSTTELVDDVDKSNPNASTPNNIEMEYNGTWAKKKTRRGRGGRGRNNVQVEEVVDIYEENSDVTDRRQAEQPMEYAGKKKRTRRGRGGRGRNNVQFEEVDSNQESDFNDLLQEIWQVVGVQEEVNIAT